MRAPAATVLARTLAACALLVLPACTAGAPEATPTPEPTVTAEPTPEPEPDPVAQPFTVTLHEVRAVTTDNAGVFAQDPAEPDQAVADAAAGEAVAALEAFLDAQFRDPDSRLSREPIEALVAPEALGALDESALAGLGDVDVQLTWTVTGPANANARVLLHGDRAVSVSLGYDARLWMAFEEGRRAPLEMLSQRGSLLFSPGDDGWRVTGIDVRLVGPDALALVVEDPEAGS